LKLKKAKKVPLALVVVVPCYGTKMAASNGCTHQRQLQLPLRGSEAPAADRRKYVNSPMVGFTSLQVFVAPVAKVLY